MGLSDRVGIQARLSMPGAMLLQKAELGSLLAFFLLLHLAPVQPTALPAYLVIGQQKSGTSTLWALATQHPQLTEGSSGNRAKEPNFWQLQAPLGMFPEISRRSAVLPQSVFAREKFNRYGALNERCDKPPKQYMEMWKDQKPGHLAGDFSALHFTCHCCPEMYKKMIPDAKIIVLLRDPVSRGLSRFMEQYNWPFRFAGFVDRHVTNFTSFEAYAQWQVEAIAECMKDMDIIAPLVEGQENQELRDWIEHRCLSDSNVVGWSAYSVFFKHWLKWWPKEQMLVLYSSELDRDPLSVMRKMEKHLGLEPHAWDDTAIRTKFNTKKQYGWAAAVLPEDASDSASTAMIRKKAGQDYMASQRLGRPPPKTVEEMQGDLTRLTQFFKPYMQQLKRMADDGIIAAIPEEDLAPYL